MSFFSPTPGTAAAPPPLAGTPSLQRALGVAPVPQPQPHTLFAVPTPQKPQVPAQTQTQGQAQTQAQPQQQQGGGKEKPAGAAVASFGGLEAIDPMTPLTRPARRATPDLGDPDALEAELVRRTAALLPRTPHRSPPSHMRYTPSSPSPAAAAAAPAAQPSPETPKQPKKKQQKEKKQKKEKAKEPEKKEVEEEKRWGRRDMALMNVLLECSRCVKDAHGEAVCWVLDPERLCARLAAPASPAAPATARVLPAVRSILRCARAGQPPAALVRAALAAFVAETFDAWCVAQADAAAEDAEEAVLWLVLAGRTAAAGAAGARAGRPELAMAFVQAEMRGVQRALAAQAAAWRACGPTTHPALVSALDLLARRGPDAPLLARLCERLASSSSSSPPPPPLVTAAVALAEWDCGARGGGAGDDVEALLVRTRVRLAELAGDSDGATAGEDDALLPLELLLQCGSKAVGPAWEALCRRVGLLAGWALVQCLEAACPGAPARAGLVRRAADALAASACAHGAWTAALFALLGTDGRADADGLPCALAEARARALYAAHAPHAAPLDARVCREVLCVPCARWAALAAAEAAEEGDDWEAAALFVRARAFAGAARCLHRAVLRRVYRAADVRALAAVLGPVRVHRAALGCAWTARLEAVAAYARLRTGADAEDAAHVHALCAAVADAAAAEAAPADSAEWRGLAHVAEHAARRLEHWALLCARADECAAARAAVAALPLVPDLRASIVEALEAAPA